MHRGWIKLHRALLDHWVIMDAFNLKLWISILLKAAHADTKFLHGNVLVNLQAGELITSLSKLAEMMNCSAKKIRTSLKLFEKEKMILVKTSNKWTHLTVCNYETYQETGHAAGTQRANNGQTTDTQRHTFKNSKNEKNVKKEEKNYMSIWNIFADKHKLPKIEKMTKGRAAKLKTRISSLTDFESLFGRALEKLPHIPFYLGDNDRNWKISFDWLINNDENVYKIIERDVTKGDTNGNLKPKHSIPEGKKYDVDPDDDWGAAKIYK